MRDLFLVLFVLGMLPLCFIRPQVGLLMWMWISYMSPHRLTWSYAYDFRFNFIIAAVTMLGILIMPQVRIRIPFNRVTFLWVFFIFWAVVTTQTAFNPKAPIELDRFLKVQLMIFAMLVLIRDRQWIDRVVWVAALSVGFWGLKGGIFTILHGGSYRVFGPEQSFFEDNNALALALILVIPLMRYLQIHATHKLAKLVVIIFMTTGVLTVLGSYSRGGFLGLSVLAIAYWLKSRRKVVLLVVLGSVAFGAWNYMPAHWKERMEGIQEFQNQEAIEEDFSVSGRLNSWRFAINLVADRPLIGGGFRAFTIDTFQKYAPVKWLHDAHSIYFEVLAEQGLPGFFAFILMFFFSFRFGSKIGKLTQDREDLLWAKDLAIMLQVSILGYASAGAFLGMAYFDLPYNMMALQVLLFVLVRREVAQGVREKPAKGGASAPAPTLAATPATTPTAAPGRRKINSIFVHPGADRRLVQVAS